MNKSIKSPSQNEVAKSTYVSVPIAAMESRSGGVPNPTYHVSVPIATIESSISSKTQKLIKLNKWSIFGLTYLFVIVTMIFLGFVCIIGVGVYYFNDIKNIIKILLQILKIKIDMFSSYQ
jgi:hypothetical protein